MLVMAFFSIGDIYRPIFYSHIPFADSQRAPTRFIIVPIVFLIILASIQFQNWIKDWNNDRWMEKMAVLIGLAFIGYDLFEHSRAWRLSNLTTKVLERYTDIIQVTLVAHPDSRYILAIIIGLALTVLSFIALAVLAYREKRTRLKPLPLQTR
jgi:ABC-type nickel/cobalt efflux system permease component RcnA